MSLRTTKPLAAPFPRASSRGTFRPKRKDTGPEDPSHFRYAGRSKTYTACLGCHPSGVSTCERCQTSRCVLIEDWSEYPARFFDARTGEQIKHVILPAKQTDLF